PRACERLTPPLRPVANALPAKPVVAGHRLGEDLGSGLRRRKLLASSRRILFRLRAAHAPRRSVVGFPKNKLKTPLGRGGPERGWKRVKGICAQTLRKGADRMTPTGRAAFRRRRLAWERGR